MIEPDLAVVVDEVSDDPERALDSALERSRFWGLIDRARSKRRRRKSQFKIVIHPDLSGFMANSDAVTSPSLVEALVDALHERGYVSVALAATADSSSLWADNRDVLALADLLGYRFVTAKGRPYDFIDLADGLTTVSSSPGTLLHRTEIGAGWLEADWRISFAKNKTDELNGFALGLESLLGVLPNIDKDYFYRHRWNASDVVCELLRAAPIGFALIDAIKSVHGSGGARAPVIARTNTIIASGNLLLADFCAALKMGTDPYRSPLNKKALTDIGLPERYEINGNLAPYPEWNQVSPIVSESVRLRESSVTASRALKPWLQVLDPELFPLKRSMDAEVNRRMAPLFANIDEDKGAQWLFVYANYMIWYIQNAVDVYRTLFNKDSLRRRGVPLGIDAFAVEEHEYRRIAEDLLPLTVLLQDLQADQHGLRWRQLGESTVFEFRRTLPIEFDQFVAKVDVSKTIQLMYDYIGGVVVPVSMDSDGRVVCQAERNLYLPQPNYLALSQGKCIDVTKLEYVEYTNQYHRLFWKTIKSENDSARYDDGIATFSRRDDGTDVSICGRQEFNLPPLWAELRLDLSPDVKADLVDHAYRTFFQRTTANLEAVVEDRDIAIGRPWHVSKDAGDTEPMPADRLEQKVTELLQRYGDVFGADLGHLLRSGSRPRAAPDRIDGSGFAHFNGNGAAFAAESAVRPSSSAEKQLRRVAEYLSEFSAQLGEAARRDVGMASRSGSSRGA